MSGFRTASGFGDIAAIRYVDADEDLIVISRGRFRNAANQLKTFFSAMAAVVSDSSVRGYGNSAFPVDITTQGVTVTVTGGVAPYTYQWTRTDGGAHSWTISSATAAFTSFTAEAVDPVDNQAATFICTVTDAGGTEAATGDVRASAINLGGGI